MINLANVRLRCIITSVVKAYRGVAQLARVRDACGMSQGSPLSKTCFRRCGDEVTKRDRGLAKPPRHFDAMMK